MRRRVTKLYAEHVRRYISIMAKRDYRKNHSDIIKTYRQRIDVKEKAKIRMRKKRKENPNYTKEVYQRRKEKHSIQQKIHRSKPEIKKQNAEYDRQWAKNNPEKVLKNSRRAMKRLQGKFGNNFVNLFTQLRGWAKIIHQDNDGICQVCGNKAEEAHHIFHKTLYPSLCLNRNNGISLCKKCHLEAHGKMLTMRGI